VWDSAELHAALSALLYAAGEVERARQHATRALQIDPRNAVATAVLGALAQR
jgi:Flp pilus assembly protein TadD